MPVTQAITDQEKRRPGPPLGSRNAMRHGLKSSALPKGCWRIEARLNALRRTLEDHTYDTHGEVGLLHALAISTAVRWERHAALSARWLRLQGENMSDGDRLAYSRDVARASSERDKAVASLNLGQSNHDLYALLPAIAQDAPQSDIECSGVQVAKDTSDASTAPPGPHGEGAP
jgi:hypothetical protein